jgi:glycosyltransferase involved in cell wall biosynthesis
MNKPSFESYSEQQKQIEKVRNACLLNEEWYLSTYRDVKMLDMDPVTHFVKYGILMKRDPNPDTSTSFITDVVHGLDKAKTVDQIEALLGDWQKNVSSERVLWAANRLVARTGFDRVLSLAKQFLSPGLMYSIHVLEANQSLSKGDRVGWLRNLNAYLTVSGVAPVTLAQESGSVLENMGSYGLPRIEHGPKVSVIIPAFNAEKTIGYAVRSILDQTWGPLEVIVIDDHSTDDTWLKIQKLAKTDSRLIVLRNPVNVGPYVTKNVGLKISTGTYVTGHDADDWALPQRIQKQVEFLQVNDFGFGLSGMLRMDANGVITRINPAGLNTQDGACASAFISLMAETRLLKGIYGHWDDLRFAGDSEMIRRIQAAEKREIPRLHQVGLFALNNPDGLTNHPDYGYSSGKISQARIQNRDAAALWHKTLDRTNAYLDFPQQSRSYPVHPGTVNNAEVVSEVIKHYKGTAPVLYDPVKEFDVCIITNLRFPAGNCSSTLDEMRSFTDSGLSVCLYQCPIDTDLLNERAYDISDRYAAWEDRIRYWYEIGRVQCKHLIVRHPRVISSVSFERIVDRITCQKAHVVINNAAYGISGEEVYPVEKAIRMTAAIKSQKVQIVPISPLIREELKGLVPASFLGDMNWSPTFNVADYDNSPKEKLSIPYRLGRHGRDGPEKWIETPEFLLQAYPNDPDFSIEILGGAKKALNVLRKLPDNWTVHEFGSISPLEYLEKLDIFAYFPNTNLKEAFGRTIIEAMISSVPCILPHKFKETFYDLAFYVEPVHVAALVRTLAENWEEGRIFLACVKRIAIANFSSDAIAARLPDLPISTKYFAAGEDVAKEAGSISLPPEQLAFKQRMETLAVRRSVSVSTS